MRIKVTEHLGDLIADCERIQKAAPPLLRDVVRRVGIAGNTLAKDYARNSAGEHGRHYPSAFSFEMRRSYRSIGVTVHQGEYGPDISKPQGGMSFEWGSRNQPPHLDLNRSADKLGPTFGRETLDAADGLFW